MTTIGQKADYVRGEARRNETFALLWRIFRKNSAPEIPNETGG